VARFALVCGRPCQSQASRLRLAAVNPGRAKENGNEAGFANLTFVITLPDVRPLHRV